MCKKFDDNRQLLTRIIYSEQGRFTENTIAKKYKRETGGSLLVDAAFSVSSHLKLQTDYGKLGYKNGEYFVKR